MMAAERRAMDTGSLNVFMLDGWVVSREVLRLITPLNNLKF